MTTHIRSVTPKLIALLISFGVCTGNAMAKDTQAGSAATTQAASSASATTDTGAAVYLPPPRPGIVLADVYGEKGDGSASYALEDKTLVSFWRGETYEVGGKRFYTGFAFHAPKSDGDDDLPDPETGVGITQATYLLDDIQGKPAWTLFHAQPDVGSFGGYGKPDMPDKTRATQRYAMKNGHLLLAIPTSRFADGVKTTGFAILTFDPAKNDLGDYKGWQYVGTAATGEDNGAACDDEGPMKCAVSTGTLNFVAPKAGVMPTLQIAMQGKVVSGPGKTRTLGASDTRTHVYDSAAKHYMPPLDR